MKTQSSSFSVRASTVLAIGAILFGMTPFQAGARPRPTAKAAPAAARAAVREAGSDLERAREALERARVASEASPSDATKSAYQSALDAFLSAGESHAAALESQLEAAAVRLKASGVAPSSGSTYPEAVTFRRTLREHDSLVAELDARSRGRRTAPVAVGTADATDLRATCEQSFDRGTAEALPLGWTSTTERGRAGTPLWTVAGDGADTGTFAVSSQALDGVSDATLDSPGLPVEAADATVQIRASFELERGFDGMVLEISIDGSPFRDILAAGGAFTSNGYNGRIHKQFGSPIAGRSAWTGSSGGYVTVGVALPAEAAGRTAVLRWRLATDYGVAGRGATLDTLTTTGVRCAAAKAPSGTAEAPNVPVTFSFTGPPVPIPDGLGAEVPGATVMANLAVSGLTGNISDVNFRFDGATCNTTIGSTTVGLDHTFVGDLVLVLRSPSGTQLTIINRLQNGGGGNGGNNFCQTVLDDSGSINVQTLTSASAPFTGTFLPASALSAFNGENPNGTWQLQVTDFFIGDTGNIRAFSLVIDTVASCTLTCPANISVPETMPGSAVVNFPPPTATGSCGTVTCVPPSGSSFPVGTTTVTCTSTAGPSCSFSVTVTAACTITCPANVVSPSDPNQCGAVVSFPPPTTTGTCGTITCSPPSGSFLPVGTTTVTCTSTSGPSCSFTVTVNDTLPPVITCPANITTPATMTQGTTLGAVVNYGAPTVTDNCPAVGAAVCTPASGSFFPVGVTNVTCTVGDPAGNTATCGFTITVGTPFGVCVVNDGPVSQRDTLKIVTDPASALYRFWQYTDVSTGTIYQGYAEYLSFTPGLRLVAHDHDSPNVRMDMQESFSSNSCTATVRNLTNGVVFTLRDRLILDDPACQ